MNVLELSYLDINITYSVNSRSPLFADGDITTDSSAFPIQPVTTPRVRRQNHYYTSGVLARLTTPTSLLRLHEQYSHLLRPPIFFPRRALAFFGFGALTFFGFFGVLGFLGFLGFTGLVFVFFGFGAFGGFAGLGVFTGLTLAGLGLAFMSTQGSRFCFTGLSGLALTGLAVFAGLLLAGLGFCFMFLQGLAFCFCFEIGVCFGPGLVFLIPNKPDLGLDVGCTADLLPFHPKMFEDDFDLPAGADGVVFCICLSLLRIDQDFVDLD